MGKDVRKDTSKVANIMSTYNYDQFRFIEGNRPTDESHIRKIMKMINEVGALWCPVLVNERMEIIDGQHRYEAFKRLNLPVIYVVQSGIGIREVRAMNTVAQRWKDKNFVHSYAHGEEAKQSYRWYENLQKQYPYFSDRVILMAAKGNTTTASINARVRGGQFEMNESEYEQAIVILNWLSKLRPYVDQLTGNRSYMYMGLVFCFIDLNVDNDYLLEKFPKHYASISEYANILGAIREVEKKIYNFNLRAPREPASIVFDYELFQKGKKQRNLRKG